MVTGAIAICAKPPTACTAPPIETTAPIPAGVEKAPRAPPITFPCEPKPSPRAPPPMSMPLTPPRLCAVTPASDLTLPRRSLTCLLRSPMPEDIALMFVTTLMLFLSDLPYL